MADINGDLNLKLQNYVSKDEQDDNFFESFGNANFWANDVAGAFSFTLGTVVSEAIWAVATGGSANIAKAGLKAGRFSGDDRWTTRESERLLRLPMYYGLAESEVMQVVDSINEFYA